MACLSSSLRHASNHLSSSSARACAERPCKPMHRRHAPRVSQRSIAVPLLFIASLLGAACDDKESRPDASEPSAGGSAGRAGGTAAAGLAGTIGTAGSTPLTTGGAGATAGSSGSNSIAGRGGGPPGTGGAAAGEGGRTASSAGAGAVGGSEATSSGGSAAALATGEACSDSTQCAIDDLCTTLPGAAVSTCRPRCTYAEVGNRANCAEGEICAFDVTGVRTVCQQRCSMGESGTEGCDPPDGCRLAPDPELTGGTAVEGLCVRVGDQPRGALCQSGDCAEGLECVTPLGSPGYCARYCTPDATDEDPTACSDRESCVQGSDGRAGCVRDCSPFDDGECDDNEACVPVSGSDSLSGRCAREGSLGQGEACSPGECQAGLLCSPTPSPFAGAESTCEPICEVGNSEACGSGSCIQATTEDPGIGTCRESCDILQADPACGNGGWCAPVADVPGLGVCVSEQGEGSAGDACYSGSECGGGLYCECRFGADTGCAGEAQCRPICVPGAASAATGGCPEGQICALEADQGIVYAFGTCRDACDLSNGADCRDSTELCAASASIGETAGVCLDVPEHGMPIGDPCTAPEHTVHEPCATMGICEYAPNTLSLVCTAICRSSEGFVGESGHPDCANPDAVCQEIRPGLAYGYCGEA